MKTSLEKQITYRNVSFYIGDEPTLSEREMHSYHEILLFSGEKTVLLSEGGQKQLGRNTLLIIPKETYHFFRLSEDNFPRMKISIPDSVIYDTPLSALMSDIKIIEAPSEEIAVLLRKLQEVLKSDCDEKACFYLYSVFMLLIAELSLLGAEDIKQIPYKESLAMSITDYISENLSNDLDIKTLSQKLHVSPSCITHIFKKEYGISIHKFILQKRLLYARNLILRGEHPSKIYTDAGFKDYSAFYKAYLSFFGYSPSKEKGECKNNSWDEKLQ